MDSPVWPLSDYAFCIVCGPDSVARPGPDSDRSGPDQGTSEIIDLIKVSFPYNNIINVAIKFVLIYPYIQPIRKNTNYQCDSFVHKLQRSFCKIDILGFSVKVNLEQTNPKNSKNPSSILEQ